MRQGWLSRKIAYLLGKQAPFMYFVEQAQRLQLGKLLRYSANTEWGRTYGFGRNISYETLVDRLPVQSYPQYAPYIERMKQGEADVLWPGRIHRYAVSSGTTGKGKHLPLSEERLQSDQRFIRKVTMSYFGHMPNWKLLGGYQLSLPGSLEHHGGAFPLTMGEISGFLAEATPNYLRPFQVVSVKALADLPWAEKFERVLQSALEKDIRSINAVPSWTLVLAQEAMQRTGARDLSELWPNLSLIFGGGVALSAYRDALETLAGSLQPTFIETYGASEGYFAYSDLDPQEGLQLVVDNGIFYEGIPLAEFRAHGLEGRCVPVWAWEAGADYVMVVSNNSGLWRYLLNDIVRVVHIDPLRIKVCGRANDVLDTYGEALAWSEIWEVLAPMLHQCHIQPRQLIAGAYLPHHQQRPHHCLFVAVNTNQLDKLRSLDLDALSQRVDQTLRTVNRHYAIRRETEALHPPKIVPVEPSFFTRWLKGRPNAMAQTKLPGILRDPEDTKQLMAMWQNEAEAWVTKSS
jgi:hypothetical protein